MRFNPSTSSGRVPVYEDCVWSGYGGGGRPCCGGRQPSRSTRCSQTPPAPVLSPDTGSGEPCRARLGKDRPVWEWTDPYCPQKPFQFKTPFGVVFTVNQGLPPATVLSSRTQYKTLVNCYFSSQVKAIPVPPASALSRERGSGLVGSTDTRGTSREGYHESRRCSRDTYPESYITKYTRIRREEGQVSSSRV